MSGLLRSLFFVSRPARLSRGGFVLPTTALLLLVLTLTVGALSFRTFSRSTSVMALREQQVIDSAAAPAIDRAKSKLEYLFSKDSRFPGGVPSSDVIASMMLNDGNNGIPPITANDPYKFPDEERLNIGSTIDNDNAWVFPSDVDGDGEIEAGELVAYSILMDDENGVETITGAQTSAKAAALVTRNGPINTSEASANCGSSRAPESGWQAISSTTLQKNFQVTAFVANRNNADSTATALEFQQVRQASRGNKWGAWFKYDLELFPGASRNFFWNGAMHTEGNFLIRDKYQARMISSHNSCLYTQDAAEITLAQDGAYRGEVLSAKNGPNEFSGSSSNNDSPRFHLFTSDRQPPDRANAGGRIGTDNDSVTADREDLRNILMDPIKLFTQDLKAHRSDAGWSHDNNWENRLFSQRQRIYSSPSAVPYLDDTYRADNRYGPKAVYDDSYDIPSGISVGAPISGNTALTSLDAVGGIYGLDGYWERRAIGQGLRIVVGQRLELGNSFGWKGSTEPTANNRDPLYPVNSNVFAETRQRRSLYDNLAAVQGMVVYHHESDGSLPLACIAATSHPGTATTLTNSRTFENYISGSPKVDFLTGNGTNGWEFDFYGSFASQVAAGQPLRIALNNLAQFAGDPNGGAPSFVPVQDSNIHPDPYLSMWGDFSHLRQVTELLNGGTTYAALSPADQSTLHSAACTLGMLAYNLSSQEDEEADLMSTHLGSNGQAVTVGSELVDAIGTTHSGVDLSSLAAAECVATPSATYDYDCADVEIDKDAILALTSLSDGQKTTVKALGELAQIKRDRKYGFVSPDSTSMIEYIGQNGNGNGTTSYRFMFPSECHPEESDSLIRGLFSSNGAGLKDNKAALALLCTPAGPKYPSLYYLFPTENHGQLGSGSHDQSTLGEEYVDRAYISDATNGINRSVTYEVVGDDGATADVEDATDTGIAAIALTPRDLVSVTVDTADDWKLPTATTAASSFDPESMQIDANGTLMEVSLLDKGVYDGRELIGNRLLDVDINKLSANRINPADTSSDHWIADTDGIVYAFREDAVREDAIVRPKASGTTWSNCNDWAEVYTNNNDSTKSVSGNNRDCRLRRLTVATTPPFLQDPPLTDETDGSKLNISIKPIDFYPDPDRRPYGFRLINGATLNRATDVLSGMTFVSDNMVYIKGDFNLHQAYGSTFNPTAANACAGLIEEFTVRLIADNCSDKTQASPSTDFYNARTASDRNGDNFADPEQDQWRPVEIVGDAVGVLSRAFRDGNIEDGFTLARTQSSSTGQGSSSYQNQHRLFADAAVASSDWKHVNPSDPLTPLLINRNGGLIRANDSIVPNSSYIRFTDSNANYNDKRGGDMQQAVSTIVNAVFISGIIPSQAGQTYGGMHNFPRFIENWINTDLNISGGFFQLNFSTSATAPFDQAAWEPGSDPQVSFGRFRFYGAPNRIWGYDVGLQYAPAGPIARRFVTVGRPRSEFYRELPVDDPYVNNLRCATAASAGGEQIDPAATCP